MVTAFPVPVQRSSIPLLLLATIFALSGSFRHANNISRETQTNAVKARVRERSKIIASNSANEEIRPIMYTFYDRIPGDESGFYTGMSYSNDEALITSWKAEWTVQGWDPMVLTLADAKSHKDFDVLNRALDTLSNFGYYDRLCFLRWLAMAAVGGGWMADYDTFPLWPMDGHVLPSGGKLTIHEGSKVGGVPSLVSGNGEEWLRLAHSLVRNAMEHNDDQHWSDMKALQELYQSKKDEIYQMEYNTVSGVVVLNGNPMKDNCDATDKKLAIHFSHYAITHGVVPTGAAVAERGAIAQAWVAQWRRSCTLP
eukprot:CAMPEP_0118710738 /NCGR_PEP_ID=MMETSP0800-20121206/23600_1 /TAXON_ID=210618 ORGANISM="Striatella unipunctata, Strain CCMP2910" /NCGR_SAMPLE_ID=MMETSP0800 /ASSEMBLY_ACC=CAM_ASM_000638 /LENGTH=310 /DNA_ID=CAMNT_0006615057 /DNA_START=108 /DNA_END=1037 /DNA_ORIENTATION=+